MTSVDFEDPTASSAPREYGGHADLTGMEDKAGGVSTVSINRDEWMGVEDTSEWAPSH